MEQVPITTNLELKPPKKGKNRSIPEQRWNARVHIRRKMKILKSVWNEDVEDWTGYNQPHRLNKKKIHCSCRSCSIRTNPNHGGFNDGWKVSDQKKLAKGWGDDESNNLTAITKSPKSYGFNRGRMTAYNSQNK